LSSVFDFDLVTGEARASLTREGRAGEAARASLGNNTDLTSAFKGAPSLPDGDTQVDSFAVPQVVEDGALQCWEAVNWLSLAHARHLLERSGRVHRLMACGVALSVGREFVEVFQSPDSARGKVVGICRCGQTLCCPVCAPRVSAFRAEEVADGYKNAAGMGWDAYLVTLTAPHVRESSLMEEALWWRESWRWAFADGRASKEIKADWLGFINSAEMTYGERSGWHFHRHLLLFVKPDMGPLAVAMMRARWLAAVRRGHRDNGGIEQHAFDAKPMDNKLMAYYIAKVGAELNATTTKDSQTPLSLLRAAALAGDQCPLWVEALEVSSGLKIGSCRWSRGLRAALHLAPERADDELAEDCAAVGDVLLGYVTATQWRRIIADRLEYRFVQIANEGAEAVNEFLRLNGLGSLLGASERFKVDTKSTN